MTETVYCLDSLNIIPNPDQVDPIGNGTNDVIVKVQMSTDKLIFKAIELATLELPAGQRLIEKAWSHLFFLTVVGFETTSTDSQRSLVFKECISNDIVATALLPVTLNIITNLDDTDPTTPIFTTQVPHLLTTAGAFWPIDLAWQTISTAADAKITYNNGGILPRVQVLSPTTFSMSGFPVTTVWKPNATATIFGYVIAPPIPSYQTLADILQSLLWTNRLQPKPFTITYNLTKGVFNITAHVGDSLCLAVAHDSLAMRLGFSTGQHHFSEIVVPLCTGESGCRQKKCIPRIVKSSAGATLGLCEFQLSPGRYPTPDSIIFELNRQTNRMWFPPNTVPYIFTIADGFGVQFTLTVPPGFYNPETLSATLTELIAIVLPAFNIEVRFENNKFIFESLNNNYFDLLFGDNPTLTNIQFNLGFQEADYRFNNIYDSNLDFINSECAFYSNRYSECIYTWAETSLSSDQLMLSSTLPPPTNTFATVVGDKLFLSNPAVAHGIQLLDVINVKLPSNEILILHVVDVYSGTAFIAELGALSPAIAPATPVTISHVRNCYLNLMLASRCNNGFIANVLGFKTEDYLSTFMSNGTIIAPNTMDLNGRFYVMVEIVNPVGSAHVEQLSDLSHNKSTFLGKAVLVNTTVRSIDRFFPMLYRFFPPRRLTQIHIRFLNPDHSLYQLNGKRWSMTLRCYS